MKTRGSWYARFRAGQRGFIINPFISFPVVASGTPWVTSNPGSSLRNDYTGILGGQFIPVSSLTVTHLGCYVVSGSTTTITLYIYSGTGTTLVTSATLNPTGLSGWQYVSIAPVVLNAINYYLMRSTVNGGDQWYDGWVPTVTGVATGGQDAYSTTAGSAISGGGVPPRQYAGVNFKY